MKPTVFNYQEYERVVEENKKLKAEVANLLIRCRIAEADRPTGEWISEELANMICDEICYYKEVTVDADNLNDLCEGCLIKKNKYGRPTGWIPVSERLPENSGCVLISIAGDIEFGAYDRQNSDWAIWCDSYWNEGKRADAWMPLPEPYREDGEA